MQSLVIPSPAYTLISPILMLIEPCIGVCRVVSLRIKESSYCTRADRPVLSEGALSILESFFFPSQAIVAIAVIRVK